MASGQRGILRWQEWTPLVTQQQRLRNLIQIIAYNVQLKEELRKKCVKVHYYFTLHLTPMSSPLYTSEKLESENPKWSEIDIDSSNGAANGVVVRLWAKSDDLDCASVITVWGVKFSGLIYIGPRLLSTDPTQMGPNSIVFHMQGGYFTSQHCFLNPQPVTPRTLSVQLNASQVKNSYSLDLLLTLKNLQLSIKEQSRAASLLREKISSGVFLTENDSSGDRPGSGRSSATLRKLMSIPSPPRPSPEVLHKTKSSIEALRFRIQLLSEEKEREEALIKKLNDSKEALKDRNMEKESELTNRHHFLQKEMERCRELKRQLIEVKSQLSHTSSLLDFRRKELMSELSIIYPIKQHPNGRYTIREVYLPNSEDFDGKDELMLSVALGFVAHLVQMMAIFLNVPTRYPIYHFGSRSRILDHIIDTIPDKDRQFPLHSRGKEKLPFDYGVYLLNKNIAQLRWCCGLTTTDLRPTLSNLAALMCLNNQKNEGRPKDWELSRTLKSRRRTPMSCSLDFGLDSFSAHSPIDPGSDPQDYAKSSSSMTAVGAADSSIRAMGSSSSATGSRNRHNTEPATDLAGLMSLDITCKSYESVINKDTKEEGEHQASIPSPGTLYNS